MKGQMLHVHAVMFKSRVMKAVLWPQLQKRAAERAEKAKLEDDETKARIEAEQAKNQKLIYDALEATSHA